MQPRLLFAALTIIAVVSQLLLRRATIALGGAPAGWSGLPRFIGQAALSPWIYAAVGLQLVGYVLWLAIVASEKLGVATATLGAGFYVLMALSAWVVYGESLSPLQWIGITLVTCGVACIAQGHG
ncbi:MAG TPA: hypothetical protein VGR92_17385 [Steroidobacteraceae bacterium]|nr:hypothetical protein [Steroidobacteraceae bacterium]